MSALIMTRDALPIRSRTRPSPPGWRRSRRTVPCRTAGGRVLAGQPQTDAPHRGPHRLRRGVMADAVGVEERQPHQQIGVRPRRLQSQPGLLRHIAAVQALGRQTRVVGHQRDLVDPARHLPEEALGYPLAVARHRPADRVQSGQRVDLVDGHGQQPATVVDRGPEPVQQPQIVGVVRVQRLQIQMDPGEPVRHHLAGARHDRPAGRGVRQPQPAPLARLVHQPVAQPGVHPHRRQRTVQRGDQPPRPRVGTTGRRQGAVVLQRPGVHIQIADARAPDPASQRRHVRRVPPPVDPGVAEPERVPPAGRGLRGRRPRVLGAQRRTGQCHRQHDQQGDPQAVHFPARRHRCRAIVIPVAASPVDASRCTSSQPPLTVTAGAARTRPHTRPCLRIGRWGGPVDRPIVTRRRSP